MESLFVLVTGFGEPNVEIKKQILVENITRIKTHAWSKLVIRVCVYDNTSLEDIGKQHSELEAIYKPGIVGEYITMFAPPSYVDSFDYILLILDDVLLQPNINFNKLIFRKKTLALDIVSPTKTLDSKFVYSYMLTRPDDDFDIKITTMCEYFCFFMDAKAFTVYYNHIDSQNNPWMWGLDLLLHFAMKLRVGMMNDMHMKHFFERTCYEMHPERNPFEGMNHVLNKYGIKSINEFKGAVCELYVIKESLCTL